MKRLSDALPFTIDVGQLWKKGKQVYHIPRIEKNYGKHKWQVIRCKKIKKEWLWVYPRTKEDEPIWSLTDFQSATLMSRI